MFQELAMNFNLFKSGGESFKLRFYVGHDGSMVRLASGLGFGKIAPLRWPALGSEIVMEVLGSDYLFLCSVFIADSIFVGLADAFTSALRAGHPRGDARTRF